MTIGTPCFAGHTLQFYLLVHPAIQTTLYFCQTLYSKTPFFWKTLHSRTPSILRLICIFRMNIYSWTFCILTPLLFQDNLYFENPFILKRGVQCIWDTTFFGTPCTLEKYLFSKTHYESLIKCIKTYRFCSIKSYRQFSRILHQKLILSGSVISQRCFPHLRICRSNQALSNNFKIITLNLLFVNDFREFIFKARKAFSVFNFLNVIKSKVTDITKSV